MIDYNEVAKRARKILGVGDDWQINITPTDRPKSPDPDKFCGGTCDPHSDYLKADIEIATGLDDFETVNIIYHEITHVAHAEIDDVVSKMIKQMSRSEQELISDLYCLAMERFTERLSRAVLLEKRERDWEVQSLKNEIVKLKEKKPKLS